MFGSTKLHVRINIMSSPFLIPGQIRAGRAFLGLSQSELARRAGVAVSTVRDAEVGDRDSDPRALAKIQDTLVNEGIAFVSGGDEGGPGIRAVANRPNLVRGPTSMHKWEGVPFTIEHRGKIVTVFTSREVLDDLGGLVGSPDEATYMKTFEEHRGEILDAVALAISDRANFDNHGRLFLRWKDIEALRNPSWNVVEISKSFDETAAQEATALINQFLNEFTKRFFELGRMHGVEVYRDRSAPDSYRYYFSPRAVAVAPELLQRFQAKTLKKPDLTAPGIRRIEL
jgi:DNA-binding XRE family transcriptional regulator